MASKIQNIGKAAPQAAPSSVEIEEAKYLYAAPTSALINLMNEVFSMGEKIKDRDFLDNYAAERRKVAHGASYSVKVKTKGKGKNKEISEVRIDKTSGLETVGVAIKDVGLFTRSNKPLKKIFTYSLIEVARQALDKGQLIRDCASFHISDLIAIGAYSSLLGAEKGFRTAAEILTTTPIYGFLKRRYPKKDEDGEYDMMSDTVKNPFKLRTLFAGADLLPDGQCIIYPSPLINWSFVAQYYDLLPRYYFSLSNRASDLLEYICFLARQNCDKIAKGEPFNIGLRAIQQRLQLPSEKYRDEDGKIVYIKNPKRDIKDAIVLSMGEIMAAHKQKESEYGELKMALLGKNGKALGHWDGHGNYVLNASLPITDFLDNGYLQIKLGGVFMEKLSDIQTDTERKIASAAKKREELREKATVKYLADKMKEADKEKKGDAAETSDTESSEE